MLGVDAPIDATFAVGARERDTGDHTNVRIEHEQLTFSALVHALIGTHNGSAAEPWLCTGFTADPARV